MYTMYAHLAYGYVKVSYGQRVSKGQVLGYMDNTGTSYGGHLHFEIRQSNGAKIDPEYYLNRDLPGSGSSSGGTSSNAKWLPPVTGYNANDYNNGYAGDGMPNQQGKATPICLVAIDDPQVVYRAKERDSQNWLPWVYGKNYNPKDLVNGCAGNVGKPIDEIEFYMLDGSAMIGDATDIVQGKWLPPVQNGRKVNDTIGNRGHAIGAVAFMSKTLKKYCVATI